MKGFVYDDDPGTLPEKHDEPAAGLNDMTDSGPAEPRWRFIVPVLLVLVVMLVGLGIYARHWQKSVWVRDIIVSGNRLLDTGELREKATGLLGRDLDDVDDAVLTKRYAELPYIRRAGITKEMNGIVRVTVEERVPMVKVVNGDKVQVIDTEGYILPYRDLPPSSSRLLQVTGMKTRHVKGTHLKKADEKHFAVLKEMVEALRASEYARLLVRDVCLEGENGAYFSVAGTPTSFIVGNDGDYKEKLKKFEIFWQKVVEKMGLDGYEKVDLRFDKRVFAVESGRGSSQRISP
ncbi:FtsQ-type POTRA domain-containing protein [Prosthecochloris sp. SCSIO W1101]|uniref:cell division protein FtsQ/DivIB n=1 Tax=Prosthecochloris sp. SCSIO W1101 TaxID=2992242 RepID=UPI00223D1275|nr:FtsQ-type POTRA domain-containing protein [Prosthecochloris sp. SCSIO W1101]UZJ41406.1 FtsQ-type POTRA domain-containing protein [Prosthecochloris sp. SCSIO W1101]